MMIFSSRWICILLVAAFIHPNRGLLSRFRSRRQKLTNLFANSQSDNRLLDVAANSLDESRRQVMSALAIASTPLILLSNPSLSYAADGATLKAESTELEPGLLDARVTENVLSPPSYGMEANDIYYPKYVFHL